jgi:chaperonin GroEL
VALQNAASVASLMLTTEALIAERPRGEREAQGPAAHDDMDAMGM